VTFPTSPKRKDGIARTSKTRWSIWDHWNSQIWLYSQAIAWTQCKGPILSLNQNQQLFIVYLYISQQFFRNLELQQRSLA
jgi:hypothetical protein